MTDTQPQNAVDSQLLTDALSALTETQRQQRLRDILNAAMFSDEEKYQKLERQPGFYRNPTTGRIERWSHGTDANLRVEFSLRRRLAKGLSKIEGKDVYVNEEWVKIVAPGQEKNLTREAPATSWDIFRFPNEYANFKKGIKSELAGTSLSEWSELEGKAALISDFNRINIRTIEQLADTAETSGKAYISNFVYWKQKAQAYIADNKKSPAQANLEHKVEQQNAEIAAMREQIDKLVNVLAASSQDKPLPAAYKSRYKKKTKVVEHVDEPQS